MRISALLALVLAAASCSEPEREVYPPLPRESSSDVRACVDDDCSHETVEAALAAASDGATVRILPGVYRDGGVVRAHGVRIRAEGVHLFAATFERKANLVVKGSDTVIEGLRCSHVRVPDGNGACVRAEGENLTLRSVHFHDSQTGVLSGRTGGRFLIEDSTFERLGNRGEEAANAHGIYVGSADELVIRRSRVLHSMGEGHEVKSRAARTVIEDSVIASLDGRDSRQIDLPNGGDVVIRGNVLEKGPRSRNPQVIGIGHERGRGHGVDHAVNRVILENNTVLLDRRGSSVLVDVRDVPEPVSRNNVIIGDGGGGDGGGGDADGDRRFHSREAAGVPEYPFLPEPGR